ILRMVRNDGEAQDLCQETFLRAYRAFDQLDGEPNYRAWLYRIATNATLNFFRQRRTGERATSAYALAEPTVDRADHADDLGRRQLLARVEAAIQCLPPKQRAALIQRKFLDLSYAEVAASLGTSEEAARANVYQAVRKLREQFSRELSEVGI
ncbi:MAG: RNA polymerase sigma factor, partial [Thermomicrobiaceae bacterium]|nr:RNA polymerase sigma factor [Thermomicrobiaceae bacterium]